MAPDDDAASDAVTRLEEGLLELKGRWPAHSVPPRMWAELEELESALERTRGQEEAADRLAGSAE